MGAGTDTLTFPSGCTFTPSDFTEMSIVVIFSSASNLYSSGSLSIVLLTVSSVISTFSVMSFAFLPKFPPVTVTPMLLFSSPVLPPQPLQPLQFAKTHRLNATNITDMRQSSFFFINFISFFFLSFNPPSGFAIQKIAL
ncbi:unknown [Acidiphilium sp. CAG:727]|nr:unknown [Acidiphilium sp. CAG:727]